MMLLEVILLIVILYLYKLYRDFQDDSVSTSTKNIDKLSTLSSSIQTQTDESNITAPINSVSSVQATIPPMHIPTAAQERPIVKAIVTKSSAKIDIIPAWFDPIPIPQVRQNHLPPSYDTKSPMDKKQIDCLATYRSMTKEKSLNFIQDPFCGGVDDTETVVVVLDQIVQQLGSNLNFTNSQYTFNDSDYRAACGIADLGSIHSLLTSGKDVETAKFQFGFDSKINYDEITKNPTTFKEFILRFIKAIANVIKCAPEFIRVFAIQNDQSKNNISLSFGITTRSKTETRSLADQLKALAASSFNQTKEDIDILQYVIPDRYEYKLEPELTCLQLQKSDFDPKHNRDYNGLNILTEERRGGRPYYFPVPWFRHALKVDNKYPHDKVWLGMKNGPGEWCVAYHGTSADSAKNISNQGFSHSKGKRDAFKEQAVAKLGAIADVNGIYLATHCEGGADGYATEYPVKINNGKTVKYKMVFQCRVEPNRYTEHEGVTSTGRALRVFDEKAVRPYGILLKKEQIPQSDGFCNMS
ncbi:unnamed protein product [Adineta ricciae]|uniref:Uncharacterized protein n=1 Tax=Adineta ricciae TaxID=249248 RepID=A0A815MYN4_ADIRI|nr:unnamed protein product [Adineta ricciae]